MSGAFTEGTFIDIYAVIDYKDGPFYFEQKVIDAHGEYMLVC